MWPNRLPVAQLLLDARTTYENALSEPEIASAIAERGFTADVIASSLEQLDRLERLGADQIVAHGMAIAQVHSFGEEWDDFQATVYMPHVNMARRLFNRNPTARMRLGLRGKRARGFAAWLDQARRFYDNAISGADLQPVLAQRGITLDELLSARSRVEAIATAASEKEDSKGLAAKATEDAAKARKEVADSLTDFHEVARILFGDRPGLLRYMGIRPRRRRRRKIDPDQDQGEMMDLDSGEMTGEVEPE